MKRLKLKQDQNWHMDDFKDDVDRIVRVCAERGYAITPEDACAAWERYSETLAAGWLSLGPDDEEVYECIRGVTVTAVDDE